VQWGIRESLEVGEPQNRIHWGIAGPGNGGNRLTEETVGGKRGNSIS
jgi:hypothetical protein